MTLRTALVFDGDASGARQAANETAAGLGAVEAAAVSAAAEANRAARMAEQTTARLARQATQQRANLVFQLNDIFVSLASGQNPAMVAIQQGSQISTIYGPGGLGRALTETGKMATAAIARFWPLVLITGLVTAGIASLTAEINKSGNAVKVSMGDTALAVLQTVAGYIYDTLQPAIEAISPIFEVVWQQVVSATGGTINALVKGWLKFVAEIDLIMASLKNIFALTWQDIGNGFVDFMEQLLESMWVDINKLLVMVGQAPVKVDLSSWKQETGLGYDPAAKARYDERIAQIDETDYASKFVEDIGVNARKNALAGEDGKKGKQSDYARELQQIRERTAALQLETNVIGLSTFAAEKMRKTLELETAAKKDAIGLTPARIAEIEREANAYAMVNAQLEQQKAAFAAVKSAGESVIDRLGDAFLEGGKGIGEAIQGIVKDLAKLALQMAILNPLKNALFGGNNPTFGGLENAFAGLFGGVGQNARGTRNWRGGLSWVGEEGPEIVNLPRGSQVLSNQESMAMMGGGGRQQLNVNVIGAPSTPRVRQQPNGDIDLVFAEFGRRLAGGSFDKAMGGRYGLGPRMGRAG